MLKMKEVWRSSGENGEQPLYALFDEHDHFVICLSFDSTCRLMPFEDGKFRPDKSSKYSLMNVFSTMITYMKKDDCGICVI